VCDKKTGHIVNAVITANKGKDNTQANKTQEVKLLANT